MILKSHKQLAELIAGKKILHLNSLGKDSVLSLEWLANFAHPSEIFSLNFEFLAAHPSDAIYWEYLKRRFPSVTFLKCPNPIELSQIAYGTFQSPIRINYDINFFEYDAFKIEKIVTEFKKKLTCDYTCDGQSKYEDFSRRTKFHQKGLEFKGAISPLGMMSKKEVYDLLKRTGIKLHPCYKVAKSTFDQTSYWKMRSAMIANPKYKEKILETFPLFACDIYRYERLLK